MLMAAIVASALTNSTTPDFDVLRRDWRAGPVVYQVFVDRFVPSANLPAKMHLIEPPRRWMPWDQKPKAGKLLPEFGVWSHELEFWGGDLPSLQTKLDYIQGLGADVLYLQPIHKAWTNHKYDAQDYRQISPELGTRQDLKQLATNLHSRKMRLVLDGVFNHIGRTSPQFQNAESDPSSPERQRFTFGPQYPHGVKSWFGVRNLVVLNHDSEAVQNDLYTGQNSVVREYLRDGIDGWRLDVAFELGPKVLAEITKAAHDEKPGSLIVGEINGYPADWFPEVDGVYNFYAMTLATQMMEGNLKGRRVARMLETMVADAGLENILRSWLHLDNHDTPRLASRVPRWTDRKLLIGLQMSLPGSPVVYYGTELGMKGPGDPANRAPMEWARVDKNPPELAWVKQCIAMRKALPSLQYGEFRALDSDQLLAFVRSTDQLKEAAVVIVNPTSRPVRETLTVRLGKLMSWGELSDHFTQKRIRVINGIAELDVPARSIQVFRVVTEPNQGHSPYEKIDEKPRFQSGG
jgi:glycosidase